MNHVDKEVVNKSKLQFIPVEDPKIFIPILKERHPQSCFIYNQVISSDKFKDDLKFYTLSAEINSNSWIISDSSREDYGHDISISAPIPIIQGKEQIPIEVKECFSSGSLINWDEGAIFVALEKPVSAMILDISVNIKGNVSELHPCILYYVEKEDALNVPISSGPEAEIRRLDAVSGTDFIVSTWKYSREGSQAYVSKCIAGNASAGVFADGKWVAGVVIFEDGLLHCLYSLKEYRGRGYAKLTMNYAFREFAKEGCFPCSTVEVRNGRSIAFHESLGAKSAGIVDYIDVKKLDID